MSVWHGRHTGGQLTAAGGLEWRQEKEVAMRVGRARLMMKVKTMKMLQPRAMEKEFRKRKNNGNQSRCRKYDSKKHGILENEQNKHFFVPKSVRNGKTHATIKSSSLIDRLRTRPLEQMSCCYERSGWPKRPKRSKRGLLIGW